MEFRDFLEANKQRHSTNATLSAIQQRYYGYSPYAYRPGPSLNNIPAQINGNDIPGGLPPWSNPVRHAAGGLATAMQSHLLGVINPHGGAPMMPNLLQGIRGGTDEQGQVQGQNFDVSVTKEEMQRYGRTDPNFLAITHAKEQAITGIKELKQKILLLKKQPELTEEQDEEIKAMEEAIRFTQNLDWKNGKAKIDQETESGYNVKVTVPISTTTNIKGWK
jgi:hypothetical protein